MHSFKVNNEIAIQSCNLRDVLCETPFEHLCMFIGNSLHQTALDKQSHKNIDEFPTPKPEAC